MQNKVFEVNGIQIQNKQEAIRYARVVATESGKSVMVWESETSLPVAYIGPVIQIGRVIV